MKFPLVGPSYSNQSLNADAQSTVNWYPEAVESGDGNAKIILLPTPGLKKFVALSVTLAIAKSHSGNFTQGQAGATFQAVVTNNGELPTTGPVTVTEMVPAGLTFVSMSGTGWSIASNVASRSDSLAPGASYPALTITVNVASNANSPQVNQVCVSGGGLSAPVCSSDPAIIDVVSCVQVVDKQSIFGAGASLSLSFNMHLGDVLVIAAATYNNNNAFGPNFADVGNSVSPGGPIGISGAGVTIGSPLGLTQTVGTSTQSWAWRGNISTAATSAGVCIVNPFFRFPVNSFLSVVQLRGVNTVLTQLAAQQGSTSPMNSNNLSITGSAGLVLGVGFGIGLGIIGPTDGSTPLLINSMVGFSQYATTSGTVSSTWQQTSPLSTSTSWIQAAVMAFHC